MNIFTTNIFRRSARFMGVMMMVALLVPAIVISQSAPDLNSPGDAATDISTSPTLSWTSSAGDSLYQLQISTSIGFGTTVFDDATLTSASNTVTGLANTMTYYWRVRMTRNAVSGGGTSPYSSIRSFTTWNSTPVPVPALLPVTLGSTAGFAILSATGVTNTGVTAITGNVGTSPITGASMTGFGTATVTGIIYTTDATGPVGHIMYPSMLTTAMGDLAIAYNDAAGRTVDPIGIAGNIGGRTLYSGLYKSTGSLAITSGDLTFDAQGDPTAVWIIQIASSFNMTDNRQVFLSGGAKASNIFWQVGSLASFGSACVMKGTIIAGTSVTFVTGSTLEGRALAKTGNVTMQANTIGGTTESPLYAPVFLGTAADFRILAGTTVTIGSGTTVNGDVGGTAVVNNGTLNGTGYTGATVTAAQADLTTAYNDAVARTSTTIPTALGGTTVTTGVYDGVGGSFSLSGTVTLNGTVNDVFIFKMTGTLTAASGSKVALTGGTISSNVFWQVGDSAVIDGDFKGIILADSSITQISDSLDGRALARNKSVTVSGSSVLPVELISFSATAQNANADLRWSTATEVNNFGFEVQRSIMKDEIGNMNWGKIGFVEGHGTTNAPTEYSFIDNNLSNGRFSYRLKQIDRDGKFSYSGSVEVTIGNVPMEFALMQNYPNPFNPTTVIKYQIPAAGHISMKVFDILGNEVALLVNGTKEAGSYTAEFDGTNLSSGIYFYTISAGNMSATKKLVLMK